MTAQASDYAAALGWTAFFVCAAAVVIVGIIKTGKWPWE